MKTKTFDCVQMKGQGARRVRAKLKGLAPGEELTYWRRRSAELERRIQAARKKAAPG